jgi:hypothetical protein
MSVRRVRPDAGKSTREEDAVPQPGSHQYDKKRARTRKNFEDQGLPDQKATKRANAALQGRIAEGVSEPRSQRDAGTGHAGRGSG